MARTKQSARKSRHQYQRATFDKIDTSAENAPDVKLPCEGSFANPLDASPKPLTIHGVSVHFPCKPYPSQLSMMEKVIKGLDKQQNCLLESPTGSGKSLALLCSALAWQSAFYKKIRTQYGDDNCKTEGNAECCFCTENKSKQPCSPPSSSTATSDVGQSDTSIPFSDSKLKSVEGLDDGGDDFKQTNKSFRLPDQPLTKRPRKHQDIAYEQVCLDENLDSKAEPVDDLCKEKSCTCTCKEMPPKPKVPKIYFGTRTHKQITQIIRELKKTAYKDVRMCILGSREHTCIHPELTRVKNKTEACNEKLGPTGIGCKFNDKAKVVLLTQSQLQDAGLQEAWDLEDFVYVCKGKKACPYFVTRNIRDQADIIFCPYNYLIDPIIRKIMEINLKDQIVILDEAHNMEDAAREAASESIKNEQVEKTIQELEQMISYNIKVTEHMRIKQTCCSLLQFMQDSSSNLEQLDYNQSYKCWSGFDIVARLENMGLGPKHFPDLKKYLNIIFEMEDDAPVVRNKYGEEVKLSNAVKQMLEHLFQPLEYMYKDDMKYVEDYRVAVLKSTSYSPSNTDGMWLHPRNKRGGLPMMPSTVLTLNFWCMNPAVAFSDLSATKSIVLTSGTLSPMSTFQSELGTPFPVQLEANHIIKDSQVWVGAISQGPKGVSTQAVYKTMETFTFQDELGDILHNICMTVPHGVLCFLPSYKALQKFTDRWKETGIWGKILWKKKIFTEPKASDKMNFEEVIKSFYDVVEDDYYDGKDDDDGYEIDGALFLAVCRGKVSEGLDFANNHARAVITVGIPYPNFTDIQVKLKREYNDKHSKSRGLLSGSDWYEIQAFRALNQALGRCLRHRKDWGALILLDARFVNAPQRYCKGLSKWMRNRVNPFNNFNAALSSLSNFTKLHLEDNLENTISSLDTSFLPMTPFVHESAVTPGQNRSRTSPENSIIITPDKTEFNSSFILSSHVVDLTVTTETRKSLNSSTITPVRYQSNTSQITSTSVSAIPHVVPSALNKSENTNTTLPAGTPAKTLLIPITGITLAPVQTLPSVISQIIDEQSNCSLPRQPMKPLLSQSNDAVVMNKSNSLQKINLSKTNTPPAKALHNQPVKILLEQNNSPAVTNGSHVIGHTNNSPATCLPKQSMKLAFVQNNSAVVLNSTKTQAINHTMTNNFVTNNLPTLLATNHSAIGMKTATQTLEKTDKKANVAVNQSSTIEPKNEKMKNSTDVKNGIAQSDEGGKVVKESNRFLKFCKIPDRIERILHETNTMIEGHALLRNEEKESTLQNLEKEINEFNMNRKKPLFKKVVLDCDARDMDDFKSKLDLSLNLEENLTAGEDFEDTLNTKRRSSGGKRRQMLHKHRGSKRFKGVNFVDETEISEENQPASTVLKTFSCLKCSTMLVSSQESEIRKRQPPFLKCVKQNLDLVFLPQLPEDNMLRTMSRSVSQGQVLNSMWDTESACCVSYIQCVVCLQCSSSDESEVIGAQVMCADTGSDYSSGQTWLFSSLLKMT